MKFISEVYKSLFRFSLIMMLFCFTFTHVLPAICLKIFSYIQMKGNDVVGVVFCSMPSKVAKVGSYHHSLIRNKKKCFPSNDEITIAE